MTKSAGNVVFVTFTEESLNENFTFCAVAVFKKFTIPTGNTCVGVSFKNNAGLKTWNYIKKRPQNFFNGSLLHQPKGSRSRLYDNVRLQGLTHRSSFLFLSLHEPSPSPQPAFENIRRIPLMNQLSLHIGYFWSSY